MECKILRELPVVEKFEFPEVPCTIPIACHLCFPRFARECTDWAVNNASSQECLHRLLGSHSALLQSLCAPNSLDDERMSLACKHTMALFALDDVLEDARDLKEFGMLEELITKSMLKGSNPVEGPVNPPGTSAALHRQPSLVLFKETMGELSGKMHPELFDRYSKSIVRYLLAVKEQASLHFASEIPKDFDQYMAMRHENIFFMGYSQLVEFCLLNGSLQPEEAESPDFLDFCKSISHQTVLVNDLFSFRKEYYGNSCHNALMLLYYLQRCDFQSVVDQVNDMIRELDLDIVRKQKALIRDEHRSHYFKKLVDNLPYIASGNLMYSALVPRYHGQDNTLVGGKFFHGTVLMNRHLTVVQPLAKGRHPCLARARACPPKPRGLVLKPCF